jgi:catechol 2,3-dioxygenase-like lactoylglutathione lyase family enzyme
LRRFIRRCRPDDLEEMIVAKAILGNHTAVFAARSQQDRIRKFYGDVLGCKVRARTDEVDRFQLDDVHFCFVWQSTALDESDFLRATYLELKTDDAEKMKRKILAFGVKTLDVPDAHLYFQAPGGQVFRLVGIDEDLSTYEGSPSSRPGASASAT